jgi:hypothetical protein
MSDLLEHAIWVIIFGVISYILYFIFPLALFITIPLFLYCLNFTFWAAIIEFFNLIFKILGIK